MRPSAVLFPLPDGPNTRIIRPGPTRTLQRSTIWTVRSNMGNPNVVAIAAVRRDARPTAGVFRQDSETILPPSPLDDFAVSRTLAPSHRISRIPNRRLTIGSIYCLSILPAIFFEPPAPHDAPFGNRAATIFTGKDYRTSRDHQGLISQNPKTGFRATDNHPVRRSFESVPTHVERRAADRSAKHPVLARNRGEKNSR